MRGLVGNYDTKAYHLGASWQFMPKNTLYAVYNYAKDDARSVWATQDAIVNHYGVAYTYQMSPRSSLYATVAFMANKDQGRLTPSSAGLHLRLCDRVRRGHGGVSAGHAPRLLIFSDCEIERGAMRPFFMLR